MVYIPVIITTESDDLVGHALLLLEEELNRTRLEPTVSTARGALAIPMVSHITGEKSHTDIAESIAQANDVARSQSTALEAPREKQPLGTTSLLWESLA